MNSPSTPLPQLKDDLFDVIPEKWGVDEEVIEDIGGDQKK
jgi:hypothetical protein